MDVYKKLVGVKIDCLSIVFLEKTAVEDLHWVCKGGGIALETSRKLVLSWIKMWCMSLFLKLTFQIENAPRRRKQHDILCDATFSWRQSIHLNMLSRNAIQVSLFEMGSGSARKWWKTRVCFAHVAMKWKCFKTLLSAFVTEFLIIVNEKVVASNVLLNKFFCKYLVTDFLRRMLKYLKRFSTQSTTLFRCLFLRQYLTLVGRSKHVFL